MTELAGMALAFAREILGWEQADTFIIGRGHQIARNLQTGNVFNASDLNAVMAASKTFVKEKRLLFHFVCEFSPAPYGAVVLRPIEKPKIQGFYDDPCLALMAACVEASRKARDT